MTVALCLAGDPMFRLHAKKICLFFKCFKRLLKSNGTSVMTVDMRLAGDPMFCGDGAVPEDHLVL